MFDEYWPSTRNTVIRTGAVEGEMRVIFASQIPMRIKCDCAYVGVQFSKRANYKLDIGWGLSQRSLIEDGK